VPGGRWPPRRSWRWRDQPARTAASAISRPPLRSRTSTRSCRTASAATGCWLSSNWFGWPIVTMRTPRAWRCRCARFQRCSRGGGPARGVSRLSPPGAF
jgi:hypothetical protein